jgi:hypothetical protein
MTFHYFIKFWNTPKYQVQRSKAEARGRDDGKRKSKEQNLAIVKRREI